jgi:ribosome biogenesis SPOUT family RNA methylase Rps3
VSREWSLKRKVSLGYKAVAMSIVSSDHLEVPLNKIPYLDFPDLHFNEHESTQMPFRYVKGADGKPVMPEVSTKMAQQTKQI